MKALSFGTRILVLPSWIVSVGKSMVVFVFFMFLFFSESIWVSKYFNAFCVDV